MKIGLHDSDNKNFPNLVLMKLSAYHKAKGDDVSFFMPMDSYDKVYSSKVFTFNSDDPYLPPDTIKGGTGYQLRSTLPDEIEHICPDYQLYDTNFSVGFLTRGCPNKCSFCFVPEKEGEVRRNADYTEFTRHRNIIFMDNNVLAHDHGIEQIQKLGNTNHKVDFNQGLDARLIDDQVAKRLSKLLFIEPLRMACDNKSQMKSIEKAVKLLRENNVTPKRYFCYMLVKDVEDAHYRAEFLRSINVDPFAQPYISPDGAPPTIEQKRFARWVNHKAIFKTTKWYDYKTSKNSNTEVDYNF